MVVGLLLAQGKGDYECSSGGGDRLMRNTGSTSRSILGGAPFQEERNQVILPRLPEDHPVDGERALERLELRRVPA